MPAGLDRGIGLALLHIEALELLSEQLTDCEQQAQGGVLNAIKSARELGKELAKPLANIGHSFKEPAVAGAQALGGSLDDTLRSLE